MRFVLVHGANHGAWCWEYLAAELAGLGHETVAVDLPGHGSRAGERPTLGGYRDAVAEVIRPGDVLVGHSMGCVVATMAADVRTDVGHVVYLAGPLPVEGWPILSVMGGGSADPADALELIRSNSRLEPDGSAFSFGFEQARLGFYGDCTDKMARWAYERLAPQAISVLGEPVSVPRFWAADLPRSYIGGVRDHLNPPLHSALTAGRLGVDPLMIDSAHSPFLSRPAELAELLLVATATRPRGPLRPTLH
ncbi:hypothetical protein GCM10009836_61230 [Pseudonocardia ailaonensis]|uniref:AB hydrolase-1 domain-containing protein n=1 Tax=Pseudonocardia ailaonensis TaxID=367279 RepID=A0ABN2NKR1_9PSEU